MGDASVDAQPDVSEGGGSDVTPDVVKDAPAEAETGPTCGGMNQQCCPNSACNQGTCCGNVCVDVANDPKNCGICGHDCLGEQCQGNQCQAEKLTQYADSRPGRVRLDANNAYFITVNGNNSGSLYACSQQGCGTPTILFGNLSYGYDLVLDDTATTAFVADSNAGKLYFCPLAGCSLVPGIVSTAAQGNVDGLAFRSEMYAIIGAQPHEFLTNGGSDVSLGGGNEGANWITAPPGSQYVYWQTSGSNHAVRVGKDNTAQSSSDFWTSTSESIMQVESSPSYVAWVAQGSSTNIYTCAVSSSCSSNNVIPSGNVGSEAGALRVDPGDNRVYWTGIDLNASHVIVKACPVTGCNNPVPLAAIATKGSAVAGGVTTNKTHVYFTMEDSGTIYLYRVAK